MLSAIKIESLNAFYKPRVYSVFLVIVDADEERRRICFGEMCKIAVLYHCQEIAKDDAINQTMMNFRFGTALQAFEFMNEAIIARSDIAISYVEILED